MNDKSQHSGQIARRKFLQDTSLLALGTSLLPSSFFSEQMQNASGPASIALQLYTVRDQIKDNIADIGTVESGKNVEITK